jgi:hypothetical protein
MAEHGDFGAPHKLWQRPPGLEVVDRIDDLRGREVRNRALLARAHELELFRDGQAERGWRER